jgi:TetR/AcrR family transcriptional regulator
MAQAAVAKRGPSAGATSAERIRDAQRSRTAILDAGAQLFAERGYDAASMSEIGAAAGLSRGSPGYFFGSKRALYGKVFTAVFSSRQQATEQAFAPVRAWCIGDAELPRLQAAFTTAAAGYMGFLREHPEFVALIMREELDGGLRLSAASRSSTAMQDAFRALHRAGSERGLRPFQVQEAVLLFVSLTFAPFSYRNTLLRSVGLEVLSDRGRRRQARLTAEQLMHLVAR